MSIGDNMKKLREKKGLSQEEFGKIAGVTDKAVSNWETGLREPKMGSIQKIADYFGITKSEIIEGKPPIDLETIGARQYNPRNCIPILGDIAAGMPIFAEENIVGYTYTELNGHYSYFALRVRGDSMNAASIMDGSELIVREQDNVENGEIAVIMIDCEQYTVKRFYRQGDFVTLMPQSYNPDHKPQTYDLRTTDIQVIGLVMEVKMKVK
ncbi:MAG: LexA family protein [Eubacteriales bacterium]